MKTQHINALCGQKVEVFNVVSDCTLSDHGASRGSCLLLRFIAIQTNKGAQLY